MQCLVSLLQSINEGGFSHSHNPRHTNNRPLFRLVVLDKLVSKQPTLDKHQPEDLIYLEWDVFPYIVIIRVQIKCLTRFLREWLMISFYVAISEDSIGFAPDGRASVRRGVRDGNGINKWEILWDHYSLYSSFILYWTGAIEFIDIIFPINIITVLLAKSTSRMDYEKSLICSQLTIL